VPFLSDTCINSGGAHYYCNRSPVRVANGPAFSTISVGGAHSCGMSTDSRPFCWGDDYHGQLGQGMRLSAGGHSPRPLQVRDGRLGSSDR
jgi:alpha-tubulin suppressor-like RCC1 family protein